MRILKLQFTNINSLAGTWHIDFTHPAYVHGGIFAITGPTGAGKSTILDAICLALYGCTPRLKSISMSENEAMTRLTSMCSSEVLFQTQAGLFRCTWSQRRAHGKSDGNLQQPKHELSDGVTGKLIESQIRKVAGRIIEVTGMDLDQFTRSMLLAQGRFATFLQADAGERAPVLEQITGTEIYSKISVYVYERCAKEKKALEEIDAELNGLTVLSEDERAFRLQELGAMKQQSGELTAKAGVMRTALAWHERIGLLEKALCEAEEHLRDYAGRSAQADPLRERLRGAEEAAALERSYLPVAAARSEMARLREELDASEARRPGLLRLRDEAQLRLDESRIARDTCRAKIVGESEKWKAVRALDVSIGEKRKRLNGLIGAEEDLRREKDALDRNLEECSVSLGRLRSEEASLRRYCEEYARDASLPGALGAISLMIGDVRTRRRAFEEKRSAMAAASGEKEHAAAEQQTALTACEESARTAQAAALDAKEADERIESILGGGTIGTLREQLSSLLKREKLAEEMFRLCSEWESACTALAAHAAEKEEKLQRLEKGRAHVAQAEADEREKKTAVAHCEEVVMLLSAIDSLTEQRTHLQDGQPCPLCGSPDHPYVHGQLPKSDEKRDALKQAKTELDAASAMVLKYRNAVTRIETEAEKLQERIAEVSAKASELETRCADGCASLGVRTDSASVQSTLAEIRAQRAEAEQCVANADAALDRQRRMHDAMEAAQKTEHEARLHHERSAARLQQAEQSLKQLVADAETISADIARLLADLTAMCRPYGIGDVTEAAVDAVEVRLRTRKEAWEEQTAKRDAAEKRVQELLADQRSAEAVVESVIRQIGKAAEDAAQCRTECEHAEAERADAFGTRNPDEEERRMNEDLAALDRMIASESAKAEEAATAHAALEKELSMLSARMAEGRTALAQHEQQFCIRMRETGFTGEEQFLSARMADDERSRLRSAIDALRDEGTRLESLCVQKRSELETERAKDLSAVPAEEAASALQEAERQCAELHRRIGASEDQLRRDEEQKAARAGIVKKRERQYREYLRWDALNELIGSASGKKFQKIAQSITFEMMVAQANRVLKKMSPRYFLICDPETDLEMKIVDTYQAGEVRTTKNLSGGESFIVSLSLALGLSHMASRNVRVDSLFLDEGFGTLDEEALDTALTTLAELQQEGKTIGVISHVSALKERIATQITVSPESGGRSVLSGPGCRRIA